MLSLPIIFISVIGVFAPVLSAVKTNKNVAADAEVDLLGFFKLTSVVGGLLTYAGDGVACVLATSDGTVRAAVKTSIQTGTAPEVELITRTPAGSWSNR